MKINTQFYVERFAAIFIFTLIISGNFLAQLFPCKIQEALSHNTLVKHLFGYFFFFFFGILAIPELANISGMISSLALYLIFLINSKINYKFWISVFLLYAFIYTLHIVKNEYDSYLSNADTVLHDVELYQSRNYYIELTQNISMAFIVILTVIGFFVYMGEKKIQYGKTFNYRIFLLGNPSCHSSLKEIPFLQSLNIAFTK